VFTDQAALERQESLPEVATAMGVFETSLAADPRQRCSMSRPPNRGNDSRSE
jgi:hypothetical protein